MKFKFHGKEYYINKQLAHQLISLVYNMKKDWDFVIIITGDRTVRTGKSTLAMTICAFLAYCMQRLNIKSDYTLDSVFFDSKEMLKVSLKSSKHSIIHYDEGRESLASSKYLTPIQHTLLDYFAECGQSNNIFVIVLPDFFGLVEEIAVPRSEILINVYRTDTKIMTDVFKDGEKLPVVRFDRGRFEFFNRYKKQELYDKARQWKKKSYGIVKANFIGSFTSQWTLDKREYIKKKTMWLKRFGERKKRKPPAKTDIFRDMIILRLHNEGKTSKEIEKDLKDNYNYEIGDSWIRKILVRLKEKEVDMPTVKV